MARPGVEVTSGVSPASGRATGKVGRWFAIGFAEIGPYDTPTLIKSLSQFTTIFGNRVAHSPLRDAVETYFKEGGGEVVVVRSSGPLLGRTETVDNNGTATDADWLRALNSITRAHGPGQVSMPGRTTGVAHGQLLDHAEANNRTAILDLPNVADVATLTAAVAAARAPGRTSGGFFAPSVEIPGLVAGTVRVVPYSAFQAALIARNDRSNNANVPAAGANGEAKYVLATTQSWSDADRETLNDGGVNVGRDVFGTVRTYGYRTLVDPAGVDADWLSLGSVRLRMQLVYEAEVIGEGFVFAQLDGRGHKIAEFHGALTGMLSQYYDGGALFGETPDDAFEVDTGANVNTVESLAANELRAHLSVRMSPFAELVVIEIIKVPITETL